MWLGAVVLLVPMKWSGAAVRLEFERENYGVVAAAGGEVEVRVMMDGNSEAAGRQAVPNGLFSYGFIVRFDQARLQPAPAGAAVVEPALNFSGFSAGALVTQGAGFITVKGNIDPAGTIYTGTLLATIRLRFIGTPAASTTLTLEIFEQSPNEAVFVDGTGAEIDPLIVTRPGTIAVLEPLRIEWIAAPPPHARLTFGVPPETDVAVQWSHSMAEGDWHTLPGAPHNSGEVLDFTVADRRFYRLMVVDR